MLKKALKSPPVLAYPGLDHPVVMETDSSYTSVGAFMAQKTYDGKIHPVQFVSLTLNYAWKKYSSCELEALAVIFALKMYRVYLLSSKPFKFLTDHESLAYAFKKNDVHGRLAGWMDFLA